MERVLAFIRSAEMVCSEKYGEEMPKDVGVIGAQAQERR